MQNQKVIEWGKQTTVGWRKYRPLAISASLFLLAFICDVMAAAAIAQDSGMQWMWGMALMVFIVIFFVTLRSDWFKPLHYVVDHAGIHIQYEIAAGPLEAARLIRKTQVWSCISSADYSNVTDEDGTETPIGVLLTLHKPLESGRTQVALESDDAVRLMSLVQLHRNSQSPGYA
jgi:hypothetical protein